jgi:hypothetical protein
MDNLNYIEKLDKHNVKIETLLLFQGTDLHQDQLEDMLHPHDNDELSKILDDDLSNMYDTEIYEYFNNNHTGDLIAEVHTPVKTPFGKRGVLSWSWGTTTFTLIVAKDMDDLVEKSCKWAKKKDRELRKALKEMQSTKEVGSSYG